MSVETQLSAEGLASLPGLMREALRPDVIDLALGIPDGDPPDAMIDGAIDALRGGRNQYVDTHGLPALREAASRRFGELWGEPIDPLREMTVTAGAAGGLFCALMTLLEPGDDVVVFDPGYVQHTRTAELLGARVVRVPLRSPGWDLDPAALAAAMGPRTRAVVLANPGNPTGRILSRGELEVIAEACARWDATLIVDEIYADLSHGAPGSPAWSLRALHDGVVVLRGLSKSHSASGWRIGLTVAPAALTARLRAVHDASTLGAAAPLQLGALAAFHGEQPHVERLRGMYAKHREALIDSLAPLGVEATRCDGGIFLCADIGSSRWSSDLDCVADLVRRTGVLVAPGRMFFDDPALGRRHVRVCFGKSEATVTEAITALRRLR